MAGWDERGEEGREHTGLQFVQGPWAVGEHWSVL